MDYAECRMQNGTRGLVLNEGRKLKCLCIFKGMK